MPIKMLETCSNPIMEQRLSAGAVRPAAVESLVKNGYHYNGIHTNDFKNCWNISNSFRYVSSLINATHES